LLATFDFDRIAPERNARLLHLTASLTRALDPLLGSLAPGEARQLVGAFCDSAFFWRGQGRSLAEHFCLFQHGVWTSDGRHAEADLARLYGVLSGLNEQPEKNSPWPGHTRESAAGVRAAETFSTVWPLVSAAGEPVRLPAIIGSAPRAIPVRMTISSTGYGEAFVSVHA